ncbi:Exportin 5 [Caligus rogercresseyi]|uniref:Exportin 5 n=1 Tax=Caligus rogercresseyi TaxID=217165 RepID=A0A7T8KL84_CALRO|nr:Exportin 5 [Caligus rogercresseyi]
MLNRLTERWAYIESIGLGNGTEADEDDKDSKEVLEDVFLRQLTRDYLNALKCLFIPGGGSDVLVSEKKTEEGPHTLSEIGKLALDDDSLRDSLLLTLLRALVWTDSNASSAPVGSWSSFFPMP